MLIGALALLDNSRELTSPLVEKTIPFNFSMDQRQIEAIDSRQPDRFLKDTLSAADIDIARKLFRLLERVRQRIGYLHSIDCERRISGQNDHVSIVVENAFPGFETDPAENHRTSSGLAFEMPPIFRNSPRQLAGPSDHAVFGARHDDVERSRHAACLGGSISR
jgi:hypothetical protein